MGVGAECILGGLKKSLTEGGMGKDGFGKLLRGSAELDECGVCEGDGSQCTAFLSLSIDEGTGNILVNMNNAMDVAGFQFVVTNIELIGASGGSAEEQGFSVSSNTSGTVLGFSFTGSTIPPGDAVLVELDFNALWDEACITNEVISDTAGDALNTNVGCVDLDFEIKSSIFLPLELSISIFESISTIFFMLGLL